MKKKYQIEIDEDVLSALFLVINGASSPSASQVLCEWLKQVEVLTGEDVGLKEWEYIVDWSKVPDEHKWVAIDPDGDVFSYEEMPELKSNAGIWDSEGECQVLWNTKGPEKVNVPLGKDWRTLIYKRPIR